MGDEEGSDEEGAQGMDGFAQAMENQEGTDEEDNEEDEEGTDGEGAQGMEGFAQAMKDQEGTNLLEEDNEAGELPSATLLTHHHEDYCGCSRHSMRLLHAGGQRRAPQPLSDLYKKVNELKQIAKKDGASEEAQRAADQAKEEFDKAFATETKAVKDIAAKNQVA